MTPMFHHTSKVGILKRGYSCDKYTICCMVICKSYFLMFYATYSIEISFHSTVLSYQSFTGQKSTF